MFARFQLFAVVMLILLTSCGENEKKKALPEKPVVRTENILPQLPKMPENELALLFENCDFIDYIFIDLPFSLSQNEKSSVQQNVLFAENTAVDQRMASCKPMARKFFKIKGNIVWEADVFAIEPCYYFVFYKDNKATYANKMSSNGRNFYKNLIDQAADMGVQQAQ